MLLAVLLGCAGLQSTGVRTVSLSLGAVIADGYGGSYRYETVQDTYLDRDQPDKNSGGEFVLSGDRTKTILIRFGDLQRALGPHPRVRKATLFLTPDSAEKPELASVGAVQAAWGEGPLLVVGSPKPGPKDSAPAGSATWRHRRAGVTPETWASPGARGEPDVKNISPTTLTASGDEVGISGLRDPVQRMVDRPLNNHGFALSFAGPCSFESSQDKSGRPRLEIELEDSPEVAGPDLSVTRIDRTPTYDVAGGKTEPSSGEEVTYTAHIKNVGTATSLGFVGRWSIDERPGSSIEVPRKLDPGQEVLIALKIPYQPSAGDHRFNTVSFSLTPQGPDRSSANDGLEVATAGKVVGIVADQGFADAVAHSGSVSFEDWLQRCLRIFNETYLTQSRFSFAPSGVLERYRIQSVQIVPDGKAADAREGEDLDAIVHLTAAEAASPRAGLTLLFLRKLGSAIGLVDLGTSATTDHHGAGRAMKVPKDRFAGLMGGGDTRFDGGVARFFILPYEPFSNPVFDNVVLEPTELLSATDVAALNSSIDARGKARSPLSDFPTTTVIKAVGMDGKAISGAELAFFQSKAGGIDETAPAFTVITDGSGTSTVPNIPVSGSSPFGKLDPGATNGVFLIKVSSNGVTDYGWLKAWQLVDAVHRTHQTSTLFELRFNLPSQPLDEAQNLAEGKPVRDSEGRLPARLAGMVDGQLATAVQLPKARNAWVEIDLGRDRPVGEVRLTLPAAAFWTRFDIVGYATGEDASNATPWAKELDWDWTKEARGEAGADGGVSIAYRGTASRFRYIRIVNQGPIDISASISEIKVVPVRSGS